MRQKVGRNQPYPCGSGKKYKHCHYNSPQPPPKEAKPIKPRSRPSPETIEGWRKQFEAKIAEEKKRVEVFGHVPPIVQVEAWGKRLVPVGNQIFSIDTDETFSSS
jgi:SEC-C motif